MVLDRRQGRVMFRLFRNLKADPVTTPWDGDRLIRVGSSLVLVVGAVWWWIAQGRELIRGLLSLGRTRHEDPVRRDAGRWLGRLREELAQKGGAVNARAAMDGRDEARAVQGELQRLRFGAPATWPEPEEVFRRARATWRKMRRER
eukprot:gene13064-17385_t